MSLPKEAVIPRAARLVLPLAIVGFTIAPLVRAGAAVPARRAAASGSTAPSQVVEPGPQVDDSDWLFEPSQSKAWLGYSVASAGDVNGDGYDDVVVGAYRYHGVGKASGKVWAFYGSASGPGITADWTMEGDRTGALFGHSVATAGDVNGDGYDDLVVGAPNPNGDTQFGHAYLYYGSAAGLSLVPDWSAELAQAQAWFGRTVHSAGDVNGDGYDDVIVGAPHYDNGETDEGGAWLYLGSADGLSADAAWSDEGDQAGAWYGRWPSGAGDVNGDGYDDVIVDAHLYDGDQKDEGRAYLYLGSPDGLSPEPSWTHDGNQRRAWFSRAVASLGDVNTDGYDDVIISAPQFDNGELNEGQAYVFLGSAAGLGDTPSWTAEGDQEGALFGRRMGGTGDINADGYDDVIVGAPDYDTPVLNAGRVYVYAGSADGPSTTPDWTAEGTQEWEWFGRSVSTAGDVNGDGYADVILGAPLHDGLYTDEGAAWVFLGSANGLGPP